MLYIDAAKGQYIKFFEKYVTNLNDGGVIIFDNLLFHGFVKMEQKDIKNRNTRQLIRKLKEFLEYIQNHPEYDFELIEEGDGIGTGHVVTKRPIFEVKLYVKTAILSGLGPPGGL